LTYDDNERFEESKNLLRDGVPQSRQKASSEARHFDVEDREDGAEHAADDANQHRRREHDHVDRDRAPQLYTTRTVTHRQWGGVCSSTQNVCSSKVPNSI